jgi:NAD(P)-dependent dehydrogenase (short-subunit alcohol dehydrogenase family)
MSKVWFITGSSRGFGRELVRAALDTGGDAATTDSASIAALLRMAKVIAARMDTPPLLGWVDSELGGYPPEAQVPNYRGTFQTQVISEWSGFGGSIVRNAPIPPSAVPEGLRDAGAFEVEFRESVSELERLAQVDRPLT